MGVITFIGSLMVEPVLPDTFILGLGIGFLIAAGVLFLTKYFISKNFQYKDKWESLFVNQDFVEVFKAMFNVYHYRYFKIN